VKVSKPVDAEAAKNGTKLSRGANFQCPISGTAIQGDSIKAEGAAGRMGARLMAIVAEGNRGRMNLAPTPQMEAIGLTAQPTWRPETPLPDDPCNFWTLAYGLTTCGESPPITSASPATTWAQLRLVRLQVQIQFWRSFSAFARNFTIHNSSKPM
jgi:putative DNA methylase